jgi:hypothetical protein
MNERQRDARVACKPSGWLGSLSRPGNYFFRAFLLGSGTLGATQFKTAPAGGAAFVCLGFFGSLLLRN